MRVGDTMQVRAVATLHDQTRQIVTAAAAWQSSNTAVAFWSCNVPAGARALFNQGLDGF